MVSSISGWFGESLYGVHFKPDYLPKRTPIGCLAPETNNILKKEDPYFGIRELQRFEKKVQQRNLVLTWGLASHSLDLLKGSTRSAMLQI